MSNPLRFIFIVAAIVIAGCSGSAGESGAPPTSERSSEPAVVVAYDSNVEAVNFLAADGSILASAAVPKGFVPVRSIRPSPYVYGTPVDGALTVADVSTMTVRTYPVPGLDQVAELDGTRVLLYENLFAESSSDVAMLDMSTGNITSMRGLTGHPEASWKRLSSLLDTVVLVDLETYHSLVVPRDDPLAAWEADSIVTGQTGTTFVGINPSAAGSGMVVRAYFGHESIDAGGALGRMSPSIVVGAFLMAEDQLVVADKSGVLTQIDLHSGNATELVRLGAALESLHAIAPTVLYATGPGSGALFSLSPLRDIEIEGDGAFRDMGSGSRCALVQQRSDTFGDTRSFVIDIESATVVAQLGPEPTFLSEDGCSAVDTLRKTVVIDGAVADFGPGWFFDASADLDTVLFRGVDNVTKMLDVKTKQGIALPFATDYLFAEA